MAVNVNDKIRRLSPAQRMKVEARAAALMAEEMTLRELRKARKLTQVRMGRALGIKQDSVSRLEKRSDLLLSTLRKTVEAMGGSLSLVAEFPDRPPVVLSGIAGRGGRAVCTVGQVGARRPRNAEGAKAAVRPLRPRRGVAPAGRGSRGSPAG